MPLFFENSCTRRVCKKSLVFSSNSYIRERGPLFSGSDVRGMKEDSRMGSFRPDGRETYRPPFGPYFDACLPGGGGGGGVAKTCYARCVRRDGMSAALSFPEHDFL